MRTLQLIPVLMLLGLGCSSVVVGRGAGALRPGELGPLDSTDALHAARTAQRSFENVRWATLPWTWRTAVGNRCDEIVGRFCIWFEEGGSSWSPPEEPERVASARDSLIGVLSVAVDAHSSDPWIVGQYVHYLLEAGRYDEAEAAARECRAEPWWCLALTGHARHVRADFAGAETAYEQALAAMPDHERRRWTDLSLLIEPTARRAYQRLEPAASDALERRLWWLADPLYAVPGNERRTEHFTRHVLDRIARGARTPERIAWGDDLRELLLRYGAAAGWERVRPSTMSMERPSVVSHWVPGGRHFLPPWTLVADPTRIAPGEWSLEPERPRTEYGPAYSDAFHELEQQVAVFRRGDSAYVVAAWRVPSDSFPDSATVEAALVLAGDERDAPVVQSRTVSGRRGTLSATAAARPAVLSLELLAREARHAARARFGVRPPWEDGALIALSDLLLIDARDPLPTSLEEAIPLARSATRLRSDERIAVFWETYAADEPPRQTFVTLSVTRGDIGWARRLAERLRLRDEFAGLKLQWEDRTGAAVTPRAVVLDFARLEPGTYTLELLVAPVGRPSAAARRTIEIGGSTR